MSGMDSYVWFSNLGYKGLSTPNAGLFECGPAQVVTQEIPWTALDQI
jgi:hypothetical protein